MYLSDYFMNTEIFKILTDGVLFILIASIVYCSNTVRRMMNDIMRLIDAAKDIIKQAYVSPYDHKRKTSRFGHLAASICFFMLGACMILVASAMVIFMTLSDEMEIIKRIAGIALCLFMYGIGFYYRVQTDKAWYRFRNHQT